MGGGVGYRVRKDTERPAARQGRIDHELRQRSDPHDNGRIPHGVRRNGIQQRRSQRREPLLWPRRASGGPDGQRLHGQAARLRLLQVPAGAGGRLRHGNGDPRHGLRQGVGGCAGEKRPEDGGSRPLQDQLRRPRRRMGPHSAWNRRRPLPRHRQYPGQ